MVVAKTAGVAKMSFCPFCGRRLSSESSRCEKCGAVISIESKNKVFQCPKCGGELKGGEANCPWCGFPCFGESVEVSDAYRLLKYLENALREFIQARLSAVDRNWWETRVPEEVRKVANSRKSRDERLYPWHIQKDLSPIYYVDFADYAKIIALEKNWNQVFRGVFKDKLFIVTKLREFEPIRSAIAHSRDVSPKDLQKLKLYGEEIMACLSLMPRQPIARPAERSMLYAEVAANVNIPYGMLSIRCSDENPEILQIEFSLGGVGDVVRLKPIQGEIELPQSKRIEIGEGVREFLQVMARSEIGKKITTITLQGVGKDIYSRLFPAPIKEPLQTMSEGSLLALALDDNVVGLPWELAFDGSDFLCMKFGVGRIIYSEVAPLKRRQSKQETRVLLISNPDNSLPHTNREVALPLKEKLEKLGAIVDHMYYAAESPYHTSKENVVTAFASGLYDVIHFVGHGHYDSRFPEESYFKLADGERLSAREISETLDLATRSGKDVPFLFYAHSCEAGSQRSWDMKEYESQVLGLSHAFVRHNVAYVGAFWAANVVSADKLALAFYEGLLDRKEPLGLALTKARLTVREELGADHPNCEWANFILYGNPSITLKI